MQSTDSVEKLDMHRDRHFRRGYYNLCQVAIVDLRLMFIKRPQS